MYIGRMHLVGLLVLCFLAGGVAGSVCDNLLMASEAKKRPQRTRISDLVKQIELSREQRQALDKILEGGKTSMVELNKKVQPEFGRIRMRVRDEIRQILDPEQRQQFERLLKEREQRRKARSELRQGAVDKMGCPAAPCT